LCHGKGLSHGRGSCKRAIDYLLGDHDHKGETRARVDVLRGDPYGVAALADSLNFAFRYTSYIYGWAPEEKPTLREIYALIDDWDRLAFAGMDLDRFMSTAIQHTNAEGKIDLHILVVRVDLDSGKSFNPCPPRSLKQFDRVRDLHNHTNGWARPDDPERARLFQPGRAVHASKQVVDSPYTRKEMYHTLEKMIAKGKLITGLQVRQQAKQWGEVTAEGDDFISIKPPGAERGRRLRGVQFKLEWAAAVEAGRAARKEEIRSFGRGGTVDLEQADAARRRLNAEIAERTAYNHQRYPSRPAIDPQYVMAQLRLEQQAYHDRNREIASSAANLLATGASARDQRATEAARLALCEATAATKMFEHIEYKYRSTQYSFRRVAYISRETYGGLREFERYCCAAIQRVRAAVEQGFGGGEAGLEVSGCKQSRGRSRFQPAGEWTEKITEFSKWVDRTSTALNSVKQFKQELDEDDALDEALGAAISKVEEQRMLELSASSWPVIQLLDFDDVTVDLDNYPLTHSTSNPRPASALDVEPNIDEVLGAAQVRADSKATAEKQHVECESDAAVLSVNSVDQDLDLDQQVKPNEPNLG